MDVGEEVGEEVGEAAGEGVDATSVSRNGEKTLPVLPFGIQVRVSSAAKVLPAAVVNLKLKMDESTYAPNVIWYNASFTYGPNGTKVATS